MTIAHDIISDEEIARVHANANFGSMTPREVVNDGVRQYAVGYQGGSTQVAILLEHGLISKPKNCGYKANLTEKGKRYARAIYHDTDNLRAEVARLREELEWTRVQGLDQAKPAQPQDFWIVRAEGFDPAVYDNEEDADAGRPKWAKKIHVREVEK